MKLRLTYDCIILAMKLSTFNSLLVVRVERGVGWLSFPKIGFKIETLVMMISEWLLKSKLLKKVNLKTRSLIELHCIILVMKPIGAQFLIGRTRGEGGQVAFLRTSPK